MNKFLRKISQYSTHLIVWAIFILYETVIVGLIFNVFENPLIYVFHYLVIIVFFYAFADLALNFSVRKSVIDSWRVPIVVAFSLSVYILLHYFADVVLIRLNLIEVKLPYTLGREFILRNLFRGIYFMLLSVGYFVFTKKQAERAEKEAIKELHLQNLILQQKTEKELAQSRNATLKAQINPHFLFNSLDFIYHTMSNDVGVASEAVIHLSRMMRFAIDSELMGEQISLGEEIRHVETLFALYRLRGPGKRMPILTYDPEVKRVKLIPLVLLTLAENIIKHGDLTPSVPQAIIQIRFESGVLTISTVNAIASQQPLYSGKLGLENTKQRLASAYENHAKLVYSSINGIFSLQIQISGIEILQGI